jgi:hypothetical protein
MIDVDESGHQAVGASRIRKILIVSQIGFFACVALCYLIDHGAMPLTDGISFYGVYHDTVGILIVGYLGAAAGLWCLAGYFKSVKVSPFTYVSLRLVALCLFGLLLTPYNRGNFFNWSHMAFGVIGALLQLHVTYYLMRRNLSVASVTATVVEVLGGLICAASLPAWHFDGLLLGEIIFQVGFAWSLWQGLGRRAAPRAFTPRFSTKTNQGFHRE